MIEEREGLYYLTELSKDYLIESSPWSLGPYFASLKERPICDDMFKDEFPEGFDLHLFSNVLHDWDFSDVKLLLENSYMNLNPGGRIMIQDAHINAEKNGPLPVAEYSVLLMFASEGKCYSISEMEELLAETGFSGIEYVPTVANRSVIIGEKMV